jgi:hypothetical protein
VTGLGGYEDGPGRTLLRRAVTAVLFDGESSPLGTRLLGLMDLQAALLPAVAHQLQQVSTAVGGWTPGLRETRVDHETRDAAHHLVVTTRTDEVADRVAVRVLDHAALRDARRVGGLGTVHRDVLARHGTDLLYVLLLAGDLSDRLLVERVAHVHRLFAHSDRTLVVGPQSTASFLSLTRSRVERSAARVAEADAVGLDR